MSKKLKTRHAPQTTEDQPRPMQPQEQEKSWIELVTETEPLCAIPVLPRFQADLPNWTGNCRDPDSVKWLGERIWPVKEIEECCNDSTQDNNAEVVGEGKPKICECYSPGSESPETCSCQSPGSVECVNLHISEEKDKLRAELGPAFEEWKFDQMGEAAFSRWSPRDEKRFKALVKRNLSECPSRIESSWKSFRNKGRKILVSYYYNVYILREFSRHTRLGGTEVDTDDDEVPSNSQKLEPEELEPENNSQKKGTKSKSEANNEDKASKSGKKGAKSETTESETNKSGKYKSSESPKKPAANYAGKNMYLAGRR